VSHRNCLGSKSPGFSSITALVSKCLEIGAEVSQSVLMPNCLVAKVSGNRSHSSFCTLVTRTGLQGRQLSFGPNALSAVRSSLCRASLLFSEAIDAR